MTLRMTLPTQLVLRTFLDEPGSERYGIEIGDATSLPSGTVHPILARLERVGWLVSRWEDIDPSDAGRPPRRYYRMTEDGVQSARDSLARAYQGRVGAPLPRPVRADT